MLLSKEVEVTLTSVNIKYYEELGYEIPRKINKYGKLTVPRGTKIVVKVEDLPSQSPAIVQIQCDYCGKINEVKYQNYSNYSHEGISCCRECSNTVYHSRENHWHWNNNKTDEEREVGRKYPEYTEFVRKVLKRDSYTCQVCGQEHGNLKVHHLDGYDWCKEQRIEVTNGITLCETCHKNFHYTYGYGNNTKEQFEEWIGDVVNCQEFNGELSVAKKVYCIEENKVYNSAKILANEWGCSRISGIYEICNNIIQAKKEDKPSVKTFYGKHILWYEDYLKMNKKEIEELLQWCNTNKAHTPVICLNTLEEFPSQSSAKKFYKCSGLSSHLKTKKGTRGKLNGIGLVWRYLDEYNSLTEEEKQELKDKYYIGNKK